MCRPRNMSFWLGGLLKFNHCCVVLDDLEMPPEARMLDCFTSRFDYFPTIWQTGPHLIFVLFAPEAQYLAQYDSRMLEKECNKLKASKGIPGDDVPHLVRGNRFHHQYLKKGASRHLGLGASPVFFCAFAPLPCRPPKKKREKIENVIWS